jgi:hypothetical protein
MLRVRDAVATGIKLDTRAPALNLSVVAVLGVIGGALICLGVVILLYTYAVGVFSLTCISVLVVAMIGIAFTPNLPFMVRTPIRRLGPLQPARGFVESV